MQRKQIQTENGNLYFLSKLVLIWQCHTEDKRQMEHTDRQFFSDNSELRKESLAWSLKHAGRGS